MLVLLMPEQVSAFWARIGPALERALPPFTFASARLMDNILTSIMEGEMQCWCSRSNHIKAENIEVHGFCITTTTFDKCSDVKSLMIYALVSVMDKMVEDDIWIDGFRTLARFARSRGCERVVAYTNSPSLVKVAKMLGGAADYVFCSLEVSDENIQRISARHLNRGNNQRGQLRLPRAFRSV